MSPTSVDHYSTNPQIHINSTSKTLDNRLDLINTSVLNEQLLYD